MLRSEASKRRCCANDHKCMKVPMFVGTNMENGKENEVFCMGHVWMAGDPCYAMIQEDDY